MAYKDPADQRRAARAHYEANKDLYKARAVAHRRAQREAVKDLLRQAKAVPCTDCGQKYPYYVMQFDHTGGKNFTIATRGNRTLSMIRAELALCEVVCANCHAERTHRRGQYLQVRAVPDPGLTLF